jgi:hypothetical protein
MPLEHSRERGGGFMRILRPWARVGLGRLLLGVGFVLGVLLAITLGIGWPPLTGRTLLNGA